MPTSRKRILIFTDWYLPGYRAGGPIRSLANLVNVLVYDFLIVTRNTDHHSTEVYPGISPNTWLKISDNVQVIYLEEQHLVKETYLKILRDQQFDKIYFNSLFSPRFTLLPLRLVRKLGLIDKCILAPRGMLKTGALSVKPIKKTVFLFSAKVLGLYNDIVWHATSNDEKEVILKHFPTAKNIRIAPNLSDVPLEKPIKPHKVKDELNLICIARISPEKGILEALKYLKATKSVGEIRCDFYGIQQNNNYLEECRVMAESMPHVKIRFRGEIHPSEIPQTLKQYHFFYMATLGENFGHAIAEALAQATPVIISNLTPWRGLQAKNAGWDLPMDEHAFARILSRCCEMSNSEYVDWSNSAYLYGRQVALDPSSVASSYALFA